METTAATATGELLIWPQRSRDEYERSFNAGEYVPRWFIGKRYPNGFIPSQWGSMLGKEGVVFYDNIRALLLLTHAGQVDLNPDISERG